MSVDIAGFTHLSAPLELSDGSKQWAVCRSRHVNASGARLEYVQVAFGNFFLTSTGERTGKNPIMIEGELLDLHARAPLLFGGEPIYCMEPGQIVWSDPCAFVVDSDDAVFCDVTVKVAEATMSFPVGRYALSKRGERLLTGGAYTQKTSVADSEEFGRRFAPCGMIGRAAETASLRPRVLFIGDSVGVGVGDCGKPGDRGDADGNVGFLERTLDSNHGWLNQCCPGETVASFVASHALRSQLWRGAFTHCICQYGVNDLGRGDAIEDIQANLQAGWRAAADHGMWVAQTMLTPQTASTDQWRTVGGQTASTKRLSRMRALNKWLLMQPNPLNLCLDITAATDPAGNGIWPAPDGVAQTNDGIHPNFLMNATMAKALGPLLQPFLKQR